MTRWQRQGGVSRAGDIGGDFQATEAYGIRYTRPDRPEAVVDVAAYGETRGDHYVVTTQTEMTLCEDPKDPGGTETWADATYHTAPQRYRTPADADRAARSAIEGHRASDIRWDGK